MITKEQFDRIYPKGLSPEQHIILEAFLQGCTDQKIARKVNEDRQNNPNNKKPRKTAVSIRHDLPNICALFGIKNEPGEREKLRPDLRELFCKYKPEMVAPELCQGGGNGNLQLEAIDKPVPLDSRFYIERYRHRRQSIEQECFEIIDTESNLRLKSAHKRGKTSLLMRILEHTKKQGWTTVEIDLRTVTNEQWQQQNDFFLNFYQRIHQQLNKLEFNLEEFGRRVDEKVYFQDQILAKVEKPLLLVVANLESCFTYEALAKYFLGMLRSWIDETSRGGVWRKLKVILLYSTEIYIELPYHQSPFNLDENTLIELPDFSQANLQDLAKRHQLQLADEDLTALSKLIGGHPYLARLTFYKMVKQRITITEVLDNASSELGIYGSHLSKQWGDLVPYPELQEGMKKVVMSAKPVNLDEKVKFKLVSKGLVKKDSAGLVTTSYQLYQDYFTCQFSNLGGEEANEI